MGDGFQFIDIILFAMIAAFLVFRLRSVLGRRDGHEGGYADPFKREKAESTDDNVVPLPDRADPGFKDESPWDKADSDADDESQAATPLMEGLAQIRKVDSNFQVEEFLSGAKVAFEMVLDAYAGADTATLKPLLSPEVYANFAQAIREREQAGETLEDTLVGMKSAELVEAYMEDKTANLTIKFVSQQINATRDENGEVIDGDPNAVIDVTDFWTFARNTRSRDPNWTLVATRSLD